MSPDQIDQIISLVSGLLTILVGALVRHYLPPRDGRSDETDPPAELPPSPAKPKEAAPADE